MLKLHEQIRKVMGYKGWKSHDLQAAIAKKHKLYSESTITRRLREMPDVKAIRPKKPGALTYKVIK